METTDMSDTDMSDMKNAGPFTITIGLYSGHEYIYVTHRESGKQWMSKDRVSPSRDTSYLAANIEMGITKFDHTAVMGSSDHRFWMPVKQPKHLKFPEESC
jgi:hypothetical protein